MTRQPEGLGGIFDQDAALYDAMRPTYPPILFDQLAQVALLDRGSTVLEIGAGTGQATLALAQRGYLVVALEPGPSMAAIAREKLWRFRSASIEVAAFEAWPLPADPFDAVLAATSFHWVDPAVRITKAADALRDGGTLAVLSTHHVAGGDEDFFERVQACYERFDPSTPPGLRLSREHDIAPDTEEIERSGLFEPVEVSSTAWEGTYTAADYKRLLMTYSGHRALHREARDDLLNCIVELIERSFGGRITKRYLFQLATARRHG